MWPMMMLNGEVGDLGMVASWRGEGGSSAGSAGEAAVTVVTMVADGAAEGSDVEVAGGAAMGFGLSEHWARQWRRFWQTSTAVAAGAAGARWCELWVPQLAENTSVLAWTCSLSCRASSPGPLPRVPI